MPSVDGKIRETVGHCCRLPKACSHMPGVEVVGALDELTEGLAKIRKGQGSSAAKMFCVSEASKLLEVPEEPRGTSGTRWRGRGIGKGLSPIHLSNGIMRDCGDVFVNWAAALTAPLRPAY